MSLEVISSKDIQSDRRILEQKKNAILIGLEYNQLEDNPKYLNSGLNSIMSKIATKNKNYIGIDLERIRKNPKIEKARLLARIRQNIKICAKTSTLLAVRDKQDKNVKIALIESLGGSSKQSSQAISF